MIPSSQTFQYHPSEYRFRKHSPAQVASKIESDYGNDRDKRVSHNMDNDDPELPETPGAGCSDIRHILVVKYRETVTLARLDNAGSARVIAGSKTYRRPPVPEGGNSFSFKRIRNISIRPLQKTGRLRPDMTSPDMTLSTHCRLLRAEATPSSSPVGTAISIARLKASLKVCGALVKISSATFLLV